MTMDEEVSILAKLTSSVPVFSFSQNTEASILDKRTSGSTKDKNTVIIFLKRRF